MSRGEKEEKEREKKKKPQPPQKVLNLPNEFGSRVRKAKGSKGKERKGKAKGGKEREVTSRFSRRVWISAGLRDPRF